MGSALSQSDHVFVAALPSLCSAPTAARDSPPAADPAGSKPSSFANVSHPALQDQRPQANIPLPPGGASLRLVEDVKSPALANRRCRQRHQRRREPGSSPADASENHFPS